MNKREEEEHASWEAQTSCSLVSIFSWDPAGTTESLQICHGGSSVWLIGRGEAFSAWGAETGTVPCGLFPLPFALSCANAYLRLMIFRFSFPMLWSPSSWFPPTHPLTPSICFPLSLFLSPSPSPRPVLPSSQSLFLLEFLSLRLLLLSLFCTFVRWVS